MMIDLSDCDRIFPKDEGFKSLIELSILLGRVVKMCYTPTGVINVKDEQAQALANEIQSWLFALPPTLSCVNHSPEHAPISAGLLNLCYVAVQVINFLSDLSRHIGLTRLCSSSLSVRSCD